MSHTTYASGLLRPQTSSLTELLRELFKATPLAIFIAALQQGR